MRLNKLTALGLFKSLPELESGQGYLKVCEGDSASRVLLVTPALTQADYKRRALFSSECGQVASYLLDEVGLGADTTFRFSCNYIGTKATKLSCAPMRELVLKSAKERLFGAYVFVGTAAFKHILGHGKAPPSNCIATGTPLFPEEVCRIQTFVLPDIDSLYLPPPPPDEAWRQKSLNFIMLRNRRKFLEVSKVVVDHLKDIL